MMREQDNDDYAAGRKTDDDPRSVQMCFDGLESVAQEKQDEPSVTDSVALRRVGKEVLESNLEPEAWALALAESRGTKDDALACYSRIRSESLTKNRRGLVKKEARLEARRVDSFQDYKTANPRGTKNRRRDEVPRVLDALFWHVVAVVGLVGCLMAGRILWPDLLAGTTFIVLCIAVGLMQLIPTAAWWFSDGRRGSITYANTAQMTACVILVSSVVLGMRLIENVDILRAKLSRPLAVMSAESPRAGEFFEVDLGEGLLDPADPFVDLSRLIATVDEPAEAGAAEAGAAEENAVDPLLDLQSRTR